MFVVLHVFVVLHICLCLKVPVFEICDSCQYFAGMLIHFRSGEFQALDMSIFSKGHAKIFVNFGMICAR